MLAEESFFLDDFATEGAISFIKAQWRDAGLAVALEDGLDAVCRDTSGNTAKLEDGIVTGVADLPVNYEAIAGERAFLADTKIRECDVLGRGQAREELRFLLTEEIYDCGAWDAAKLLVVL